MGILERFRSVWVIAARAEVFGALVWLEDVDEPADEVSETVDGALSDLPEHGPAPKVLLADKGYDADFIREDMARRGGTVMIKTKRNRLIPLPVDAATYALRKYGRALL